MSTSRAREYIRVTPTSESVPPQRVPETLSSLQKLATGKSLSVKQALNPFHSRNPAPPTVEFVVVSEGTDQPVEFYYSVDDPQHFDTLEQRLQSIYPATFDLERVESDLTAKLVKPVEYSREEFRTRLDQGRLYYDAADLETPTTDGARSTVSSHETSADSDPTESVSSVQPDGGTPVQYNGGTLSLASPRSIPNGSLAGLDRPTATADDTVLARPALAETTRMGVRWEGTAERKQDYMTTLTPYSEAVGTETAVDTEQTTAPLAPLIDYLTHADQPLAFQILFTPKADWTIEAVSRQRDLERGRDTLFWKLYYELFPLAEPTGEERGPEPGTPDHTRLKLIQNNTPKRTFTAVIRAMAAPSDESDIQALDATLQTIQSAFDPLDGEFYELTARRLSGRKARKAFTRFQERTIATGRGNTRPNLVLNGDELANFTIVPSASHLSQAAMRGTQAEQQSRSSVAGPRPELRPHYKDGMAVGDLSDTTGYSQPETMHLPATLMRTHWARFAATGSGKSTGLATDALSTAENTRGPEIVIEPKDGDVIRNFMRAYAAKHGFDAFEEDVLYFPVPEVMPGLSLFDMRQSLAAGKSRTDISQNLAERYIELIKLRMGTEAFNDAKNAATVINYLIDALLDEEYGRENGRYRASADYFSHEQFQHVINRVMEAIKIENTNALPKSSTDQTTRSLNRYLMDDPPTAKNILRGVATRADTLSRDPHIRTLFNNTTPNFDFRDLLETDKIVLFDLSGLRKNASKSMAAVLLTMLYDALDDRNEWLNSQPDNYVVNLFVDEAHTVTVADTMNTLLEQGRGYRIGVGLYAQFAEQMRHEGGEQVYQNTLNNIHTRIVGNIPVDEKLAEALATEEMDPEAVKNRLRAMPPGEWFVRFPSPKFFESPPRPFTVRSRPIPPGHAEGEEPLNAADEERFQKTIARMASHTDADYGAEESPVSILTEAPLAVMDLLDLHSREMDRVLANLVKSAQVKTSRETANEAVDVTDVIAELRECYEIAEECSTEDMPDRDELVAIMERSRLLELSSVEAGADSDSDSESASESDTDPDLTGESEQEDILQVELAESSGHPIEGNDERKTDNRDTSESESDTGSADEEEKEGVTTVLDEERENKPAVGTNRTSGGEEHSRALKRIDAALHSHGWSVNTVKQDSNDLPDARAYHAEVGQVVHVEAEHTTPEVPMKVIQNYLKAVENNAACFAVVEEKPDDPLHWARRVENILSDLVKRRGEDGTVEFYTDSDELFEFPGGGHVDGTVKAVRRTTGGNDSRRSVWTRETIDGGEDEYVLRTNDGKEVTRIMESEIADPRKANFPGVYRYRRDSESGTYVVYEGGDKHTYESKEAFTDEWVTVKQPFIPEIELNEQPGENGNYVIIILPADETDEPYLFGRGSTAPLSELVPSAGASESPTPTPDEDGIDSGTSQDDQPSLSESLTRKESKQRFVEKCLFTIEDLDENSEFEEDAIFSNGDLVLPKDDAVTAFNTWQNKHLRKDEVPEQPKNKSRFTRDVINPYAEKTGIDWGTVERKLEGDPRFCYTNFGLTEEGRKLL